MDASALIREQLKGAHELLEGTMAGVTAEQAHWQPAGKAQPLGANYAHTAVSEDFIINGMLKGAPPLAATAWAGKTGISEMPPQGFEPWDAWARRVRIDLAKAQEYAKAVYANTDAYVASLSEADVNRSVDLSEFQLGQQTVAWVLCNIAASHVSSHMGEISCLKGLQGLRGYPF